MVIHLVVLLLHLSDKRLKSLALIHVVQVLLLELITLHLVHLGVGAGFVEIPGSLLGDLLERGEGVLVLGDLLGKDSVIVHEEGHLVLVLLDLGLVPAHLCLAVLQLCLQLLVLLDEGVPLVAETLVLFLEPQR